MSDISRATARPGAGLPAHAIAALCGVAAAVRRFREARRATRHIRTLDDRILRDIGVTRWQIGAVTRDGRDPL